MEGSELRFFMRDKATRIRVRVALGSAGHTEFASVLQCQKIPGKQHELVCALFGNRVEHTAPLS